MGFARLAMLYVCLDMVNQAHAWDSPILFRLQNFLETFQTFSDPDLEPETHLNTPPDTQPEV